MEFIRQVGNQAEVNDGGKIRRLPFSGVGVAPQQGAKVNPVKDACCCPGAVPLVKENITPALHADPRRTTKKVEDKRTEIICVPPTWLINSFNQSNAGLFYKFGGRYPLGDLLGKKIKICLHPSMTNVMFPIPKFFLQWDLSNNTFDLRELKPSDKSIYIWGEEWYGGADVHLTVNIQKDYKVEEVPYSTYKQSMDFYSVNPNNGFTYNFLINTIKHYNLKVKEGVDLELLNLTSDRTDIKLMGFQPFRDLRPISDYTQDVGAPSLRAYQREIDDPTSYFRVWVKDKYPPNRIYLAKDLVAPLKSRYELMPKSVNGMYDLDNYYQTVNHLFFMFLRPESTVKPELFLKWYRNPRGFNYERIH